MQQRVCSPNVQKILALRRQAATLRAAHEEAMGRLAPRRHQIARLEQQARALKGALTACEIAELRRAWSGV
jgi:hypothetical protein